MAEAGHGWHFVAATSNGYAVVIAVCDRCGLIRRGTVTNDGHIDLRGECPGEPQEPKKREHPIVG